jgi:hypothetical protein
MEGHATMLEIMEEKENDIYYAHYYWYVIAGSVLDEGCCFVEKNKHNLGVLTLEHHERAEGEWGNST